MSETSSKQTMAAPSSDSSTPLLYSYQEQQPTPYSAAPAMYNPPKADTAHTYQPSTGYESFQDIIPEAASETTPIMSSSSFDDKSVRRGFVRKVRAHLTGRFRRIV